MFYKPFKSIQIVYCFTYAINPLKPVDALYTRNLNPVWSSG